MQHLVVPVPVLIVATPVIAKPVCDTPEAGSAWPDRRRSAVERGSLMMG
jgi:hypothetical protein